MSKFLNYIKRGKTFEQIYKKLGITREELAQLIVNEQLDGNKIDLYLKNGKSMIRYNPQPLLEEQWVLNTKTGNRTRILVISDTHLASKHDCLEALSTAYDYAEENGIEIVLHCGDMTEGFYKNRPDHVYDVRCMGATEQAEYVREFYPKRGNIRTYFITGNHDHTHIKNGGADIGKMISRRRDLTYLGFDIADIIINKTKIRLRHPSGGPAYALSYKLQKYIDALPSGEKPHLLFQGHYHNTFYMYHRNIHAYQVPGLQKPTPYILRKGLNNNLGFWDVEFESDKDGNVVDITNNLHHFHNKNDHKTLVKRK